MIKEHFLKVFSLLKKELPLLLIFLVIALLHLYKGKLLFFWQVDEDIVGLTIKRILIDHRPQLIGFPFPGGIYPGPAIYYILSLAYLISQMNPLNLPFLTGLIATFTTIFVFYVGKEIFKDAKTGLFAAIIFGFSFLINIYSRLLNGLTFAPILALTAYIVLAKSINEKRPVNILLIGLILSLSVQNEGSSISIFFLILFSFFIFKIRINVRQIITLLSIFILFHLPPVVFDLRHQFVLLHKFLAFVTKGSTQSSLLPFFENLSSNLQVFPAAFIRLIFPTGKFDVIDQIFPCSNYSNQGVLNSILLLVMVIFILLTCCHLLVKVKETGGKLLAVHLIILIIGLGLYSLLIGNYKHEWITVVYLPGFSLILGFYLSIISKISRILRIFVFIFIGIFLTINLRAVFSMQGHFGLLDKTNAVKYALSKVGDNSFYLDSIGSCYDQGYNYLFWYFGSPPSYTKNLIIDPQLVGQKRIADTQVGVIIVAHSDKNKFGFYKNYTEYKNRAVDQKRFRDIEVLILK